MTQLRQWKGKREPGLSEAGYSKRQLGLPTLAATFGCGLTLRGAKPYSITLMPAVSSRTQK